MGNSPIKSKTENAMSEKDAIYNRRAVRDYLPNKVDKKLIQILLDAAVHAPTAMHEEPWGFVIIQDKNLLNRLSDSAKTIFMNELHGSMVPQTRHMQEILHQPEFNVFYNASTLIVIYSKFQGKFVDADCWLAAENLMLTACANGLGTCVIGFAVPALNSQQWKNELNIPQDMIAIAPIIVGFPASETPPVPRKPPEVITWK